ncbi:hypothetical protein SLE2022_103300 [Rubroshorea leprosula]
MMWRWRRVFKEQQPNGGGWLLQLCLFHYPAGSDTRNYRAALSLTSWVCLLGTIEGSIVALVMEGRKKASVWALKWDTKLLTATYSVRKIL